MVFCWSKNTCSFPTTTFYIISGFFHQELMKQNIELFDQNYGLTSLKKERFLILSKMDICSCLKKAGFYPPHHFTLFLASFHEKCFKGNTECFDQNHGLTLSEKSNSGTLKKERFLAIVQKDFFFFI